MEPVSWASAFWGLVVFALNAMGQPSGAVCGVDADVSFELRSSPILCIFDCILIVWRYINYIFYPPQYQINDSWTARVSKAHIRLLRFRFQDEFDDPSREGDLAALLKNRYTRLILFDLTVSQIVKLYGYSGIPGTQTLATMYLASFFTIELLVTRHRPRIDDLARSNTKEPAIKSSGSDSLAYISIAASVAVTFYFATVASRDMFGRPEESLLRWIGLVIPVCGATFCVPMYLYSALNRHDFKQLVRPGFLLAILVSLPLLPYMTAPVIERGGMKDVWHDVLASLIVVVWTGICIKFASATTKIVRKEGVERARKRMEKGAGIFFVLFNVTTAILYYRFSYDPRGTKKAPWTDYLG